MAQQERFAFATKSGAKRGSHSRSKPAKSSKKTPTRSKKTPRKTSKTPRKTSKTPRKTSKAPKKASRKSAATTAAHRKKQTGRSDAKEMARKQRDISVSEFFAKNRHLLGFDNPSKALLTTIKEGVDNSLDACEEAGFLPDIRVEIKQLSETRLCEAWSNGRSMRASSRRMTRGT